MHPTGTRTTCLYLNFRIHCSHHYAHLSLHQAYQSHNYVIKVPRIPSLAITLLNHCVTLGELEKAPEKIGIKILDKWSLRAHYGICLILFKGEEGDGRCQSSLGKHVLVFTNDLLKDLFFLLLRRCGDIYFQRGVGDEVEVAFS